MLTTDVADRFIELFDGNHSAIGLEEGGCMHLHSEPENKVWEECVRDHLDGDMPIGVYPMVHNVMQETGGGYVERLKWAVKWGAVDFDEGEEESWVHAKNVHLALQTFGITGWIERSRSKGYHVWVFAQLWVHAKLMRRALLAACQLVDAPTREINPKQEELREDQLGNYIRLPYPGWLGSTGEYTLTDRRVVVSADGEFNGLRMGLTEFVNRAHANRTSVAALSSIAAHYTEPKRDLVYRDWGASILQGSAIDRLAGKALVIFTYGPLEGTDRSSTLWKLARYLKEDGRHTIEEALELVRDADRRWGKMHLRPDGEQRLNELIQKAWF